MKKAPDIVPYCDPEIQVAPQRQHDDFDEPIRLQGDENEIFNRLNEKMRHLSKKVKKGTGLLDGYNFNFRLICNILVKLNVIQAYPTSLKVEKAYMEQIAQAVNQSERQIRDEVNSRLALVNRNQQQTNIEMKNAFQVTQTILSA